MQISLVSRLLLFQLAVSLSVMFSSDGVFGQEPTKWTHEDFAGNFSITVDLPDEHAFTGHFVKHWGDKQVRTEGYFKPGHMREGVHCIYWDNGLLREVAYWKDGWAIGTIMHFRPDGSLEHELFFGGKGAKRWRYIERSYGDENSLDHIYNNRVYETIDVWTSRELIEAGAPPELQSEPKAFAMDGIDQTVESRASDIDDLVQSQDSVALLDETHKKSKRDLSTPSDCMRLFSLERHLPSQEFQGDFKLTWPSGTIRTSGNYSRNCVRNGVHVSRWENGKYREIGFWNDGWVVGTTLRFRGDGSLEKEMYFGDSGAQSHHFIERNYDLTGRVLSSKEVRCGIVVRRWQ